MQHAACLGESNSGIGMIGKTDSEIGNCSNSDQYSAASFPQSRIEPIEYRVKRNVNIVPPIMHVYLIKTFYLK